MLTWIVGLSRRRNSLAALSRFALLERKSSRRGSVAIQMAIMMTVLIGMAGLGTEVPYMMYKHRQMQTAADSGALGAAVALTQGYPAIATEADGIAAALGFTNGSSNVTVTVNNPPKSGNYTTNSSAVEVIVTQPQTLKMAGLFGVSTVQSKRPRGGARGIGRRRRLLHPVHGSNRAGVVGVGGRLVGRRCGHDDRVRNGRQRIGIASPDTAIGGHPDRAVGVHSGTARQRLVHGERYEP